MGNVQFSEVELLSGFFRRSSRDEALALAKALKEQGKYQYFRGQTRNVAAIASFYRIGEADQIAVRDRYEHLARWAYDVPGLDCLRNEDRLLAVAQHYGIPTPFLDFTTDPEVAAYFSTCSEDRDFCGGDDACIICLNMSDLNGFLRCCPREWRAVELLNVKVPNLWRLESQQGVFLHCPIINFESVVYPFDRIVFPQTADASSLDREKIYPSRKSHLEVLLDEYFYVRRSAEGVNRLLQDNRGKHLFISSPINGTPNLLINEKLPPEHASWNGAIQWLKVPTEAYFEAACSSAAVRVFGEGSSLDNLRDRAWLRAQISRRGVREKLLEWGGANNLVSTTPQLGDTLNSIWDGMRRLPYNHDDIASALGNATLLLTAAGVVHRPTGLRGIESKFSELFGAAIEIEIGTGPGGAARALVPIVELLKAVRYDISDFVIIDDLAEPAARMVRILQAAFDARSVYDFDRFCRLFARYVIPTQVINRNAGGLNIFCPARVNIVGLP